MVSMSVTSHHSYILELLIKITILVGWFSRYLKDYTRHLQEASIEEAELRSLIRSRPSQTLTSFPQFGRLPLEIRQQIWQHALPDSRVLLLRLPGSRAGMPSLLDCFFPFELVRGLSSIAAQNMATRRRGWGGQVWSCRAPVPPILHVNREARAFALQHYRLGLAPGYSEPRIYVDFTRDTIGLSDEVMQSPVGRNLWRVTEDVRHVRSLALSTASAASFLGMRQPFGLEGVSELLLVDSVLWSIGILPAVAGRDWSHWARWQCKRGTARWGYRETTDEI
ncbi:hypothetical protein QBC47DRAFT_11174 [Echria macrotheca]|uniref:2EXR domain-containing protein n=1 Tax=Echria macrotheca TaxID=438768 RepID=A0AAJ0F9V0_9PEZI|nr:hypothetical protein QBC47DRAFT_11174 [Echria macrotheca]